jgi:MFS family permease
MNELSKSVLFASLPSFISSLEATMILMVIPLIAKDLSITYVKASTLLSIYIVIEVLLSIPFSLLAEKVGVKMVIILGTMIMALSSFLIIFSNSFLLIFILRIFQGIGASIVLLTSLSYASLIGSDKERGKMIGLNHTIVSLGYVFGLPLGGIIAEINWKYLFAITSVLSFISLFLILSLVGLVMTLWKIKLGKVFYLTSLSGFLHSITFYTQLQGI